MTSNHPASSEVLFQALYEMGQQLELHLTMDEEGSCTLLFQESWPLLLQLVREENRAFVSVLISDPSVRYSDAELLKLTEYGWLGFNTFGIALSPDRERHSLVGWRALSLENLTAESLQRQIENFLSDSARIRQNLETFLQEENPKSESTEHPASPILPRFA